MPRLVRKKPLSERVKAWLNPMDTLLWLSEELETRDWDSKALGTQLGLGFNFVFLLARANSLTSEVEDDVFNDAGSGSFITFVVSHKYYRMTAASHRLTCLPDSPARLDSGRPFLCQRLLRDDPNEAIPAVPSKRR